MKIVNPTAGSQSLRGILVGRDVMLKGMGWIIGSYSMINI